MKKEESQAIHVWQVEKPTHFRYSLSYEDIPALVSCYDSVYLLTSPVIDIVCFKLPTDPEEFSVELYIGFPDRETRAMICAKEYTKDMGPLRRFADNCVKEYLADETFDDDWAKLARKIMLTNDGRAY